MSKNKNRAIRPVYAAKFKILQIPKLIDFNQQRHLVMRPFSSPIFGTVVKDEVVNPHKYTVERDIDKQLDPFRVNKLTEEERIKKYGKLYHEFMNVITEEMRDEYLGIESPRTVTSDVIEDSTHEYVEEIQEDTTTKTPFIHGITEDKVVDIDPVDEAETTVDLGLGIYDSGKTIDIREAVTGKKEEPKKTFPKERKQRKYILPPYNMLEKKGLSTDTEPEWLVNQREQINKTLADFKIDAVVANSKKGPTVTRYEIEVGRGVNVNRILSLKDNLMKDLAANSIRIEAPIPGKPYVGIEVANEVAEMVMLGNVLDDPKFKNASNPLFVGLGIDIDGNNIYTDIAKMPHGLVAGATNSGKSVCINTIIVSLLYKNTPEDLKFLLIDPKMVELAPFNGIPHLITPVVNDLSLATQALNWVVKEMDERYLEFRDSRVRDIKTYNERIKSGRIKKDKMPYIVIVIDELAELMMTAPGDVESAIKSLTQKARAAGIHLIVATQRPSTDVVSGTIKSNITTRIAFRVATQVDSSTILDHGGGAEELLGRGDMLYKDEFGITRLQGAFVDLPEIEKIVDFISDQQDPNYAFTHEDLTERRQAVIENKELDDLFPDVARYVVEEESASMNRLSREFRISFNRARDIMDSLIQYEIVGGDQGTRARDVLVTMDELEEILERIYG